MKPRVKVIGEKGFVGSRLSTLFKYYQSKCSSDVVIDAAGSSLRYKAQEDPWFDFIKNVKGTFNNLMENQDALYIYVSTIGVYNTKSNYGCHKALAEDLVMHYAKNYIILRCSAIIGPGMKKGILHDLLNGESLRLTANSMTQFISTDGLAEVLDYIITNDYKNSVFDVGGTTFVSIKTVKKLMGIKTSRVLKDAKKEDHFTVGTNIPPLNTILKTSEEYINDVLEQLFWRLNGQKTNKN